MVFLTGRMCTLFFYPHRPEDWVHWKEIMGSHLGSVLLFILGQYSLKLQICLVFVNLVIILCVCLGIWQLHSFLVPLRPSCQHHSWFQQAGVYILFFPASAFSSVILNFFTRLVLYVGGFSNQTHTYYLTILYQ